MPALWPTLEVAIRTAITRARDTSVSLHSACASGSARDQARQGANDADHRRGLADDRNGGPWQGGQIEAAGVKQEGDVTAVKTPTHQYAGLGSEIVIENGGG